MIAQNRAGGPSDQTPIILKLASPRERDWGYSARTAGGPVIRVSSTAFTLFALDICAGALKPRG